MTGEVLECFIFVLQKFHFVPLNLFSSVAGYLITQFFNVLEKHVYCIIKNQFKLISRVHCWGPFLSEFQF